MFHRCHAVLPVQDLEPVVEFYEQVLGFVQTDNHREGGALEWIWLRCDKAEVMFYSPAASGDQEPECTDWGSVRLYFVVDRLESLRTSLVTRGCTPTEIAVMPYGMYEFDVLDPSGYRLTFAERFTQD